MEKVDYSQWRISRWETPASSFKSARRESLCDRENLVITLQEGIGSRRRVQFTFSRERLYRNINETYLLDLGSVLPRGLGATWTVEGSDFWNRATGEPHAADLLKGRREYVFVTEDDVIQVISANEPRIEVLGPADPETPPPGLSEIRFKRATDV